MNLRLSRASVRTYVHRGPVVESSLDVATRGQEKEKEKKREEEREREEKARSLPR